VGNPVLEIPLLKCFIGQQCIENKTVSGLSRETQKGLWIRVTFKNFSDNNNCDAERSPLHEKVKQSEVLGEPFRQL